MFSLDEADTAHVFHIAELAVWQASAHEMHYVPSAFANEGFIHLSYARQVRATAARYYAGRSDLLLLRMVKANLGGALRDENLVGGSELFPHLYAPLARDVVNALARIHWTARETFELRALSA